MTEEDANIDDNSSGKKIPYGKLAWDKAIAEGRMMIDNRDGKEHRRFSVTLRPSQVSKSFKACLNNKDFDEYDEKELLLITKKLIDLLGKRNPENFDKLHRYYRGRLEDLYKTRRRARKRVEQL